MFRLGFSHLKCIGINFQTGFQTRFYCVPFDRKKFTMPSRYVIQPNVWVDYARLAAEYQPVNLGMGFPDFPAPESITQHLVEVAKDADLCLQMHTCPNGHERLCEVIAAFYTKLTGIQLDPKTEVFASCGAYAPLYCAINGHCQEGDEVVLIDPAFSCYEPQVRASGAEPKFVALKPTGKGNNASDWVLDPGELQKAFTKRTKMIIINTPHNPTGKMFSCEELEFIADLCIKCNVICVSDEVYEWFYFEPNQHVRMCEIPKMWDRTITIGSSGKAFGLTGWKTGWAYAPNHLMRNIYQVHKNCIGHHCTPIQEAVARALEMVMDNYGTDCCFFKKLRPLYQKKADYVVKMLGDTGLYPVMPQGGYFVIADWTPTAHRCDFRDEKDPLEDFKFTKWMTRNFKIQFTPCSAFYSKCNKGMGESFIRACLVKTDETLEKAAKQMCEWQNWARAERLE